MQALLDFARGPLLIFAFAVFLFGMLRLLVLFVVEMRRAYVKAGDQAIPMGQLFRRSLGWVFPIHAFRGTRILYTGASLAFHVGMLLVPLFLSGHIQLIREGIGIGWPALPGGAADALTLAALAGLFVLFFYRLFSRASRSLTTFQDWFLLVLCMVPFVSGWYVAHPAGNPLPFTLTYLIHLLSAELLLILVPFTKLAHVALFPFTQFNWEMGWHFVPESGDRVRIALGKEGEPV